MEWKYSKENINHINKIPARIIHQMVRGTECYVPLHWHKDIEINLLLMGEALFTVNGKKCKLSPGEFIIINSEDLHKGEPFFQSTSIEKESYMELITIQWDYDFLNYYVKNEYPLRLRLTTDKRIIEAIRNKIIDIGIKYLNKSLAYEMEITALLLEIGSLLLNNCVDTDYAVFKDYTKKQIGDIQDAITYINANYKGTVTLKEVSEHCHLTESYFSRKFSKVTGCTFHQYITDYRLKESLKDLKNTDYNITEIAMKNGFPNVKSFIEAFKKKYTMTPQKYRNLNM